MSFEEYTCYYICIVAMDAIRDWNLLFSNEAMCRVYSVADRHERASGVPCIMNAITRCGLNRYVSELKMSPSQLIGHLQSIGWAGRLEFVERLSVVYNWWAVEQGG